MFEYKEDLRTNLYCTGNAKEGLYVPLSLWPYNHSSVNFLREDFELFRRVEDNIRVRYDDLASFHNGDAEKIRAEPLSWLLSLLIFPIETYRNA